MVAADADLPCSGLSGGPWGLRLNGSPESRGYRRNLHHPVSDWGLEEPLNTHPNSQGSQTHYTDEETESLVLALALAQSHKQSVSA